MKKLLFAVCSFFVCLGTSLACEITIRTEGGQNSRNFSRGEQVTAIVRVKHIHRVCRLDIEDTIIEAKGLKVLNSTDWKEVSPGLWEQKLIMKVTGAQSVPLKIKVSRECSRGFHEAELNLLSKTT